MASRQEATSTVRVNVEIGTDTFKNLIFNHISPAKTDDQALWFGNYVGNSLCSYPLNKVVRVDTATLQAE